MPLIKAWTDDGSAVMECPQCKGNVFAKLLFIGGAGILDKAGGMRGYIGAMCERCKRKSMVTLPVEIQPGNLQPPPLVDEKYYQEALDDLS